MLTRLDRIERGIEALQKSQLKTDRHTIDSVAKLAESEVLKKLNIDQMAESDAQMAKMIQIFKDLGIYPVDEKVDFFISTLQEKKKLGDIQFDAVALQLKAHKGKVQDEFDIVMYNGNAIGLVEVKHKVHPSDIEKLVSAKLPNFRKLFPQYADFDFYLGIAGMSVPKDATEMAEKSGLAVLRQKGDVLQMNTNLKAF